MLRAFVAIELPAPLQDELLNQTATLQKKVGQHTVRWVSAHNLHLTLKFLGDISESQLDLLKQTMIQEARPAAPFSLEVGGLGAFPSLRRPRVIWIGVQAPVALASLQRSLEGALARIGFPPEAKAFAPHLTLGRAQQSATQAELQILRAGLEATALDHVGSVAVDSIHLFKSDLRPGGAFHTRLFSAKLGV